MYNSRNCNGRRFSKLVQRVWNRNKIKKENQEEGTDWLLICKKSRIEPVVVMDA